MIGNYNNDYDYDDNEYLNDDTIEIPLSCEDDEYREDYLREQEQEKKSVLQKMIEYKNESTLFGNLYEMSGVIGFSLMLLVGFVLTLPILLISRLIAFFITIKEKRGSKNGV
ncbi:hypothetical protein ACIP0I_002033 [Salmonella enterica]|uniref:Uncharacterized protein n=1 Tax=Salmonella enterica subsp. enterica serovar Napoli TaxID=1151001 RepID=A0A5J2KFB1_SALET|nr:hypothetical protein [Salmonella enterica]ECS5308285.1 hypothetical protein [Salmonella enterica subsp. enterica serovar Napoli]ECE2145241.1 hypothetical protein [Salmonella enterica]ECZ8930299.1 hypothetical protein [Salmonella enterica subsp. enterica serovar Napoli]EDA7961119.1 hypothetical protein [Salmonella enterica subsp. enterica serovar Napoli]